MFGIFKKRRRQKLTAMPFPAEWLSAVENNVPLFLRLPSAGREELLRHTRIFLAEKHFEGCGGLALTGEIKATIAAQACLLLLNRETDYYPRLVSILVYPSAYVVPVEEYHGHGLVSEGEDVLDGEAWEEGVVVLAWDEVQRSAEINNDGRNLVLHEFAHILDMENGEADGVPELPETGMYSEWARVMKKGFKNLRSEISRGGHMVLDEYGASSPAEFFAVATESFFETPLPLKIAHPLLYEQLKKYYRQDPEKYQAY